MPLKIIRQDITKIKCDAIVNPTNPHYAHGGGTDASIHAAAGEALYRACVEQGPLSVGHAVITPAFALPCKYVIHTVGPYWRGGMVGEEALLRACYIESLKLAVLHKCKTVAIPLISSGSFGFPKDRVLRIAMDTIEAFLLDHEIRVYVVVYDKESTAISLKLFADVQMFIDDNYVGEKGFRRYKKGFRRYVLGSSNSMFEESDCFYDEYVPCREIGMGADASLAPGASIEDLLGQIDESFSEMLLRKIDESGMTDAECYKKANVDRKLFSKIRSNKEYRPSKNTVLAFAVALRLPLDEVREMLAKAGFALSHSSKFDIIVEYFIVQGTYDLFAINETLLAFDQKLLGM